MASYQLEKFQKSQHVWDPPTPDDTSFMWCVVKKVTGATTDSEVRQQLTSFEQPLPEPEPEPETDPDDKEKEEEEVVDDEQLVHLDPPDLSFLMLNSKSKSFNLNVFAFVSESQKVHPIAINMGKNPKSANTMIVNVLQVPTGPKTHRYLLITDLDSFLILRTQSKKSKNYYHRRFFCEFCVVGFWTKAGLEHHKPHCRNAVKTQIELMPTKDKEGNIPVLKFKNFNKKFAPPMILYYDFESALEDKSSPCVECAKANRLFGSKCRCNSNGEAGSYTEVTQVHKAISYSFLILDMDDNIVLQETQACPEGNAGEVFLTRLLDLETMLTERMMRTIPIIMDEQQELEFQEAKTCHICEEDFAVSDVKTRDHEHYNGVVSKMRNFTSFFECHKIICFAVSRSGAPGLQRSSAKAKNYFCLRT